MTVFLSYTFIMMAIFRSIATELCSINPHTMTHVGVAKQFKR